MKSSDQITGHTLKTFFVAAMLLFSACATRRVEPSSSVATIELNTTPIATTKEAKKRVPLFAYYYIWFDVKSWERAKTDFPLLGNYSSDDTTVMRHHLRWAKDAGIDGFIVGWKSTPKLDARLDRLLRIADEEHFKIVILYQALDFERNPLAVEKIRADLEWFASQHLARESLNTFGKPVMIWSGTWAYTTEQIASVTRKFRDKMRILATSKSVKDYERIASMVDGNAYYWSSVNIETNKGYETKLNAMADVIHKYNGLWFAPAAPGFDARMVGGSQVVERNDGQTLRTQLYAAQSASPDAIGLISWNEFSENSHIEPSLKFGLRYLEVLKEIRGPNADPQGFKNP
jgi:hypothetical protein